ncbi:MAG: hypothetical protein CVV12_13520 [Gammaproteobacteria bacterium HGW-Gammaproteobacteria-2]|nr:MAG: hypothetical protein CVV12_13520 [Gammaproteobacteria bacterium HGW-Gammaproteobacteria-2]
MSRLQNRLLGASNLLVLMLAFIALVAISTITLRGWRVDLTENALYTLSPGTLNIIEKIDEPIHLYFYFSDQVARDMPQLRTYAQRVRELLEEMASPVLGSRRSCWQLWPAIGSDRQLGCYFVFWSGGNQCNRWSDHHSDFSAEQGIIP